MPIFFDWNSTTRPLPAAAAAVADCHERIWFNPSSRHACGRAARAVIEQAREAVASLLGTPCVVLTGGGTEANNLGIESLAPSPGSGLAVALTRMEHPSVSAVASHLNHAHRIPIEQVRATPGGRIDLDHVREVFRTRRVGLVCLAAVSSEVGTVQPVTEVSAICRAHGARLHVDAIQGVGRVTLPQLGLLADAVAIASHKMMGPKGIGALGARCGDDVRPILHGGSQEGGKRPGTQDAALSAGFAVAAEEAIRGPALYEAVREVRDFFEQELVRRCGAAVNGEEPRAAHVSNLSFRALGSGGSRALVDALDHLGLCCSSGTACSASAKNVLPSATIEAMWGDVSAERWRLDAPVRFSLPPYTTREVAAEAIAIVERAYLSLLDQVSRSGSPLNQVARNGSLLDQVARSGSLLDAQSRQR